MADAAIHLSDASPPHGLRFPRLIETQEAVVKLSGPVQGLQGPSFFQNHSEVETLNHFESPPSNGFLEGSSPVLPKGDSFPTHPPLQRLTCSSGSQLTSTPFGTSPLNENNDQKSASNFDLSFEAENSSQSQNHEEGHRTRSFRYTVGEAVYSSSKAVATNFIYVPSAMLGGTTKVLVEGTKAVGGMLSSTGHMVGAWIPHAPSQQDSFRTGLESPGDSEPILERFNPFDKDSTDDEESVDSNHQNFLNDSSQMGNQCSRSQPNQSPRFCTISSLPDLRSLVQQSQSMLDFKLADVHFEEEEEDDEDLSGRFQADFFQHGSLANTEAEIESQIERLKHLIRSSKDDITTCEKLVARLIKLRIMKQERKERSNSEAEGGHGTSPTSHVLGHAFVMRRGNTRKHTCEHCARSIFGFYHRWFQCIWCHARVHSVCLQQVTRACPSSFLENNRPQYELRISPQVGLLKQKFRCFECKKRIALSFQAGCLEARLCDYTGYYYCSDCHWNDKTIIPARILLNWDFEPRVVSRPSKSFLKLTQHRGLIDAEAINPRLVGFIEDLADVSRLRSQLLLMKEYLVTCQRAKDKKLLLLLADRPHFVESHKMYSLKDLNDLRSGLLLPYLKGICAKFIQHIKFDCMLCKGKGFICEVCHTTGATLFPFDDGVSCCSRCLATFHKDCWTCVSTPQKTPSLDKVDMSARSSSFSSLASTVRSARAISSLCPRCKRRERMKASRRKRATDQTELPVESNVTIKTVDSQSYACESNSNARESNDLSTFNYDGF